MTHTIESFEMEYTGGGCWVAFCMVRLPTENRTIWASVSDELVALYHTKDNCDTCENAFVEIWTDELLYEYTPWNTLAFDLVNRFNKELKEDRQPCTP